MWHTGLVQRQGNNNAASANSVLVCKQYLQTRSDSTDNSFVDSAVASSADSSAVASSADSSSAASSVVSSDVASSDVASSVVASPDDMI